MKEKFQKLTPLQQAMVVLLLFIGVVLLLALAFSAYQKQKPNYAEEYTDPDTGEVISTKPNVDDEAQGNNTVEDVLGVASLGNYGVAGLTPTQLALFKQDLSQNALSTLGEKDEYIKVIDARYDQYTDKVVAKLKMTETNILSLEVSAATPTEFSYTIKDGVKVVYDSGLLTTNQDYTGDGTPPEQQP